MVAELDDGFRALSAAGQGAWGRAGTIVHAMTDTQLREWHATLTGLEAQARTERNQRRRRAAQCGT